MSSPFPESLPPCMHNLTDVSEKLVFCWKEIVELKCSKVFKLKLFFAWYCDVNHWVEPRMVSGLSELI